MKQQLLYVELKQGHSGPAWIGVGQFSKSGQSIYFDDKVLRKSQGIYGNHVDIETGEEYWVSGVKKNGLDRHYAGGGKIFIGTDVVEDYLKIINAPELPKNKFILTNLIKVPNKALSVEIENEKHTEEILDNRILYKKTVKDLNDVELQQVIDYYTSVNLSSEILKSRKLVVGKLNEYIAEEQSRKNG